MFRFVLSKIRLTKNPKDMRNRALLNKAETSESITGLETWVNVFQFFLLHGVNYFKAIVWLW